MDEKKLLLTIGAKIPADAPSDDFDVDDVRAATEEFAEKLVKTLVKVDDAALCYSDVTTLYRTTGAWAEVVNFCLGRLTSGVHVHAEERYGRNMNEHWLDVKIFVEPVAEDEAEDEATED
jgi:hypothetical protein